MDSNWAEEFRGAERRLKDMLLGDGLYMPGKLKGEEARAQVRRDLRRMRDAFDAARAASQSDRVEAAEARISDLEEELKKIAASKARRARGVIGPPKAPSSKPAEASTGSRSLKTGTAKTSTAKAGAAKAGAAKAGTRKVTKRQPKRSLEAGSPARKKRRAG